MSGIGRAPDLPENCQKCGAATEFDQYGPHTFVVDTDYRAVGALLAGDLDEARCEVCGGGLGFRQNLYVLLPDSRAALVAPGDGLRQHAETGWPSLRSALEEQLPGVQLIEMASAEALRAEVWERIGRYHTLFENLERAKKDGRIGVPWLRSVNPICGELLCRPHPRRPAVGARRRPAGSGTRRR
jgi:hypothetical protein